MNDGKKTRSVTLTGRTLYKNGDWNTLCLPFNVEITGSPLDGDDVDVRKMESSSYENGVLMPKRPIEPEAVFGQIKYNIQ